MNKKSSYRIAVVGATGAVGQKMVQVLESRNFPVEEIKLLASSRSAGTQLAFKDKSVTVEEATPESFEGMDIALFSAGGTVSEKLAPEAVRQGCVVIDNSSHFRMDPLVPLVVPEVNGNKIQTHQGIIANPNCSTIQMVAALNRIHQELHIRRIVVSTYQAVSGTGIEAMNELIDQSLQHLQGNPVTKKVYPHQIAYNVLPQIDVFTGNGFTKEEMKMVNETKKIFEDDRIDVNATCVRVPVLNGHSESVYIETEKEFSREDIVRFLEETPGVIVQDNPSASSYPLPVSATGQEEVFVGRIRKDLTKPNACSMWIVSDNLLKGAALNAVQIAECLVREYVR